MNTGHGHVTPRPDGGKARCGGPALCTVCARELAQAEGCQMPCDQDGEAGPVHCWNWHRPNTKPDWHDPARCDHAHQDPTAVREATR